MSDEKESNIVSINEDDLLYRRLHFKNFRRDGGLTSATYTKRPPSTDPDPEISVNLAKLATPEETLNEAPSNMLELFGIGVLRVHDVRELGFTVRYYPVNGNNAHCIIEGLETETDCQDLADKTSVCILPPKLKKK